MIVALTADAYSQDRDKCQAAGMDHFLTKPLLVEELRMLLARIAPELSAFALQESVRKSQREAAPVFATVGDGGAPQCPWISAN